jgi:hypothetical protein
MCVPTPGHKKNEHRPTGLLRVVQPRRLDGAVAIVGGTVESFDFFIFNTPHLNFIPNHFTGVDRQ